MTDAAPVPPADVRWKKRSWQRDLVVAIITVATGIFLAWFAEQIPQNDIAKQGLTRALVPVLTPLYDKLDTGRITVVTVDDLDLESFNVGWPLKLDFLTRRVKNILDRQPRALFIDLLLKSQAPESEIDDFHDVICNARGTTRVYIASLGEQLPYSAIEKRLLLPQEDKPACATAVNVEITANKLDQLQWEYPAEIRSASSGTSPRKSTAFHIYCDLVPEHCPRLTEKSPPMAMVWPASSARTNVDTMIRALPASSPGGEPVYEHACRDGIPAWEAIPYARAAAQLTGIRPIRAGQLACPYHPVIPLRAFRSIGFREAELVEAIANSVVMLGGNIIGAADRIVSPVNGALPGVHAHAMALDNLMSFSGRYKQSGQFEITEPTSDGSLFVILSVLFTVTALTLWNHYFTEADPLPDQRRFRGFRLWRARAGMLAMALPMIALGRPRIVPTVDVRQHIQGKVAFISINVALSVVLFVIGYAWLRQGPLSMVEYVIFPFVAHFTAIGKAVADRCFALCTALADANPWAAWDKESRKQGTHGT